MFFFALLNPLFSRLEVKETSLNHDNAYCDVDIVINHVAKRVYDIANMICDVARKICDVAKQNCNVANSVCDVKNDKNHVVKVFCHLAK